jgi:hypothetical protein
MAAFAVTLAIMLIFAAGCAWVRMPIKQALLTVLIAPMVVLGTLPLILLGAVSTTRIAESILGLFGLKLEDGSLDALAVLVIVMVVVGLILLFFVGQRTRSGRGPAPGAPSRR